eukprot:3644500-Amphidinium_carterae.1
MAGKRKEYQHLSSSHGTDHHDDVPKHHRSYLLLSDLVSKVVVYVKFTGQQQGDLKAILALPHELAKLNDVSYRSAFLAT